MNLFLALALLLIGTAGLLLADSPTSRAGDSPLDHLVQRVRKALGLV